MNGELNWFTFFQNEWWIELIHCFLKWMVNWMIHQKMVNGHRSDKKTTQFSLLAHNFLTSIHNFLRGALMSSVIVRQHSSSALNKEDYIK